ncbi:MAG: FIST C-terminal domain-containing protein [Synergistaceae bacterium]|jgi:hypothetical protein|nr:FIST C-terminal domain-containing protein [Synergistaceae bacterium]
MLKAMTAQIREIDDVSSAVSALLAQLDMEKGLRGNSVGILTCGPDFVGSGVVKALCEKLPFDVVGAAATDAAALGGLSVLSLIVLTSDDVLFSAALSRPLDRENSGDAARDVCLSALKGLLNPDGSPSPDLTAPAESFEKCVLGLTVIPFMQWSEGDEILGFLDEATGGVPLFGMRTTEIASVGSPVLFNGEAYFDRLAVVLLSGNVRARFAAVSIMEHKVAKYCALVTGSERNILKTVDDIPIAEYLEKFGLAEKGRLRWKSSIPLLVDRGDGSRPTSVVILDQTPEGYVRMGASVPLNSTIRIGSIDRGDVLESVSDITGIAGRETGAFLFFSCALRGFTLDLDGTTERDRVRETLGDSVPYLFAYTGGEICPLYVQGGQTINRFHNMTAIGCALNSSELKL